MTTGASSRPCTTCAYHHTTIGGGFTMPTQHHCAYTLPSRLDPVTGDYYSVANPGAYAMRSAEGRCGPYGLLWTPKPPEPPDAGRTPSRLERAAGRLYHRLLRRLAERRRLSSVMSLCASDEYRAHLRAVETATGEQEARA